MFERLRRGDGISNFVEHDRDIRAAPRMQPERERKVHRLEAKRVRHVLHENAARVSIELTIEKRDSARPEMTGQTTHLDSVIDWIGKVTSGSPNVHNIARAGQFNCNQPRIVTHSAGLRRVLAGYDMPMLQNGRLSVVEIYDAVFAVSLTVCLGYWLN